MGVLISLIAIQQKALNHRAGWRFSSLKRWLGCALVMGLLAPLSGLAQTHCDRRIAPGADIQAALNALPTGTPQTLCLAPGHYRLDHLIAIRHSHLTLQGAGDKTVLQMRPGVSSPVLVLGDLDHKAPQWRVSHIRITRLAIQGGGMSKDEFMPGKPYLSNSGIVVRAGDHIELDHLRVSDCRSACILTEYSSRDVTIRDNTISGAVWDGISLNRAGATRILNNVIRNNTAAGITVEHLEGGVIKDNRILDNGSQGMYLAEAIGNHFQGNQLLNNHLAGIFLTCSVKDRNPVQCWRNSMSRGNHFVDNRFHGNRFAYQVAPDEAANCRGSGYQRNISQRDRFSRSRNQIPSPRRYGHCLILDRPDLVSR